jgi:hypothetical protein
MLKRFAFLARIETNETFDKKFLLPTNLSQKLALAACFFSKLRIC